MLQIIKRPTIKYCIGSGVNPRKSVEMKICGSILSRLKYSRPPGGVGIVFESKLLTTG